jgi:hypothetical protein
MALAAPGMVTTRAWSLIRMAIALKSPRSLRLAVRLTIAALLAVLLGAPATNAADIAKVAPDIPKDAPRFTEHVAEQVRVELADVAVTIEGPLTLRLGGMQANLDRIFDFCKRDSVGCPHEVNNYVKAVAQVYHDQNAAPARDAVRVVLRTESYVQQVQGSAPPDASAMQPRAFAPGLVVLPALDSPRTIRMLNEKDDKALGLRAEEVYELGLKNTSGSLKPLMQVAKAAKHAEIGQLVGDSYEPSRLVLHDDWAPLAAAQNGTLIVAAPATDAVFYIGEDTPAAIDALRTLVRNVFRRAPNRLSETLLRWNDGGWEVVK